MSRYSDKKRRRREYVKRKAKTYAKVFVVAVLPWLVLVGWVIWLMLGNGRSNVSGIVLCVVAFLMVADDGKVYRRAIEKLVNLGEREVAEAKRIPYVPRVTSASLTAEDVLLRGAEKPSASGATLLRPVEGVRDTNPDELLKSSDGGGEED